MKKKIFNTEFEIDYSKFTAKVLNPIDPDNLIDEHIFPGSGNACLTFVNTNKFNNYKEEFDKNLETWAERHNYYRLTGFWINGHSHNILKAAAEVVYRQLHTNKISIKRLLNNQETLNIINRILDDTLINEEQRKRLMEEWSG